MHFHKILWDHYEKIDDIQVIRHRVQQETCPLGKLMHVVKVDKWINR